MGLLLNDMTHDRMKSKTQLAFNLAKRENLGHLEHWLSQRPIFVDLSAQKKVDHIRNKLFHVNHGYWKMHTFVE